MTNPLDNLKGVVTKRERSQYRGISERTIDNEIKRGKAPTHFSFHGTTFFTIEHLPAAERDIAREFVRSRRLNAARRVVAVPTGLLPGNE